jgi:hypothetical protein
MCCKRAGLVLRTHSRCSLPILFELLTIRRAFEVKYQAERRCETREAFLVLSGPSAGGECPRGDSGGSVPTIHARTSRLPKLRRFFATRPETAAGCRRVGGKGIVKMQGVERRQAPVDLPNAPEGTVRSYWWVSLIKAENVTLHGTHLCEPHDH